MILDPDFGLAFAMPSITSFAPLLRFVVGVDAWAPSLLSTREHLRVFIEPDIGRERRLIRQ
jgi:hypothetical protein